MTQGTHNSARVRIPVWVFLLVSLKFEPNLVWLLLLVWWLLALVFVLFLNKFQNEKILIFKYYSKNGSMKKQILSVSSLVN